MTSDLFILNVIAHGQDQVRIVITLAAVLGVKLVFYPVYGESGMDTSA
ncbi:MAG: hypothetical protein K8F91_10520 [Candidatus Obscuribacterales bacterium]|nr:hypothetical protein [Candidatus Obscuribacterales bacterium]